MKLTTYNEYINEGNINEGAESLRNLLSNESPEIQKLGSEIEKMLEPARFKIGIAYYDDVMLKIAEIAKLKK